MSTISLQFDGGTLILEGGELTLTAPDVFKWDERVRRWRAPAKDYRHIVNELSRSNIEFKDDARDYYEFQFKNKLNVELRPYQQEALAAWDNNNRRGVVILPTGAGKSLVAQTAIESVNRSALVVVPTLDLMNQWYDLLKASFDAEIGLIGGGYFDQGAIVVTTYQSAYRFMDRLGNKFGLLICDECHHLPSEGYRYIAETAIAPFRLGLTATPERADGCDALFDQLLGPIVYRLEAQHLAGEFLADYEVVRMTVELKPEEKTRYNNERSIYRSFISQSRINIGSPNGWQMFVMLSARSEEGRRAMQAYRESKRIAFGTDAKLDALEKILQCHKRERVIIFTAENDTVYKISERHLIPAITHETPVKERSHWLAEFNAGRILALATSKVLNEGVNIPEAAVAVVLSGSGSTREHIQRLGRILRKSPGKEAILYEVISAGTAEENVSERRRNADQFR